MYPLQKIDRIRAMILISNKPKSLPFPIPTRSENPPAREIIQGKKKTSATPEQKTLGVYTITSRPRYTTNGQNEPPRPHDKYHTTYCRTIMPRIIYIPHQPPERNSFHFSEVGALPNCHKHSNTHHKTRNPQINYCTVENRILPRFCLLPTGTVPPPPPLPTMIHTYIHTYIHTWGHDFHYFIYMRFYGGYASR